jgi:hypothetical protein
LDLETALVPKEVLRQVSGLIKHMGSSIKTATGFMEFIGARVLFFKLNIYQGCHPF